MQETEKIWMNGELVDWADAKIHVASHGLNYGSGVFEGIRCYDTPNGPAVFRLNDHLVRLQNSAKVLYMDLPYTIEEIRSATHEVIAANGLASCYLRPIAFYGYGELGVASTGNPVDVVIISFPWGAYLGEDSQSLGITAKISSWERVGPNVIPHVAKATGIYLNSMLATMEARSGRLRRGDHALARRLRRRRAGREHLRREGRRPLHAAARDVDPARASRATRSSRSHRTSDIGSRRRC